MQLKNPFKRKTNAEILREAKWKIRSKSGATKYYVSPYDQRVYAEEFAMRIEEQKADQREQEDFKRFNIYDEEFSVDKMFPPPSKADKQRNLARQRSKNAKPPVR
jgi:hypothetical protein